MMAADASADAARVRDPDDENYYQLLDVPYTASRAEITRAYRQAVRRAHPDRALPERRAAAEELTKLLNRAHATLADPVQRHAYDRTVRAQEVQDQLMRRYVGGFGGPGIGGADPFAAALRREPTLAARRDQSRADRAALLSMFIVFGGATAAVVGLILLWALLAALIGML